MVAKETIAVKKRPSVNMATKRFATNEVIDAIFDSDFGISDGDTSADECGEEVYAYSGESVIDRRRLREESRRLLTEEASETSNNGESDDPSPENVEEYHEVSEEDSEVVVGVLDFNTRDDNLESSHSDSDSYSQSSDFIASSVESMDTSKYITCNRPKIYI